MKYQRLEDMRIDSDLTIKELSAILECHRDVYSRYEKGIREIPVDFLIRLAKLYNCRTEYLRGIRNDRNRKFGE